MQYQLKCAWCGKDILRYPSQVGKRNFCSRKCRGLFSSKEHNPDHYAEMFDIEKMSAHMRELNRRLNPNRMTPEVREKVRQARLGTGEGKSYAKLYGRHAHRVIAEQSRNLDASSNREKSSITLIATSAITTLTI